MSPRKAAVLGRFNVFLMALKDVCMRKSVSLVTSVLQVQTLLCLPAPCEGPGQGGHVPMLLRPSVSVVAAEDTGSGGASLRARLLVGEELGYPKLGSVCPEPTGKADHPPEGHEEKRTPHFS